MWRKAGELVVAARCNERFDIDIYRAASRPHKFVER